MTKTIATLTADSLIENGIRSLYCVPGVQNDNFFDAIFDRQDQLRPVHARHEQGAVYMALGAALATRKPQAFSVVPGPGFLNGTGALCTAYALNAPLFGVVGQIPSRAIGRELGLLHEIEGQLEIMEKFTKHADQITEPQTARAQIDAAWSAVRDGRPRPVSLEIPVDGWLKPVDYDRSALHVSPAPRPDLDPGQIAEAARLVTDAKRPMIAVGGGAQDHAEAVRTLAARIGAGVIAFRNGQGIVPTTDPLFLNNPTAHSLWPECDVIIGLGARLVTQKNIWGVDDAVKIVHIDLDPSVLDKIKTPEVGMPADLTDALPALLDALPAQPARNDWRARMAEGRTVKNAEIAEKLAPQLSWLGAIRAAMPENGIFVDELTQVGFVSRFAYDIPAPRTYLSTGYQGTLGWGIATAIGAAHARPDAPVVSVTGDGGALFTISELATAVHHGIPVNVVVMNDNTFGNVKGIQRDNYNERYIACDLTSPDFVALAQSFGVTAARAATPEELTAKLSEAVANNGPNLIEVPVGEFPSPWPFIMLPKVRGL